MATNSQGLTAQQMGEAAQAKTIDQSKANPGVLQVGPSTGMTTSNTGGLAPTQTNFQAYTNPSSPPTAPTKPSVPFIAPTSNPNVLTSSDAAAYVAANQQDLAQKQKVVDSRLPDPNLTVEQQAYAEGPLIAGMKRSYAMEKQRIEEEQKTTDERMAAKQRSEGLTQEAANIKQGVAGTDYGNAVMADLDAEQQRVQQDYALQKKKLLDEAWRSVGATSIGALERQKREIAQVEAQEQQAVGDIDKKRKSALELQKLDSQEGGAIYSMVQSGYEPDADVLATNDLLKGYNPGTSQTLFAAEKAIFDREQAKEGRMAYKDSIQIEKDLADLEDRPMERQSRLLDIQKKLQDSKTAAYDEMNKIFGVMEKLPEGMQVNIGDATYFGIEGGAVFEKDASGNGKLAFQDGNGNVQVQDIGNFGKPEDIETVYVNGMQVMRNKKTKQLMPVNVGNNAQPGANVWAEKYPDGSVNPYRRPNDPMRGECAAYANDLYAGGRVWGNTLAEKLQQGKRFEVPKDQIQVEDSIVMSTNAKWGHVAIVSQVFQGEDGKTMIQLNESNYVPPGGGKISNSRTMSIDDPRLKAVCRIPLNPERSPSSPGDSLNAVGDTQRTPAQAPSNPFVTPNVVMSEAQQLAADQKWEQTQSLMADLIDGADEKELFQGVPADVRNMAKRMAKEQEFKDFSEQYRSSIVGPSRPEDVKREFENYQKAKKAGTGGADPETVAQNIFNGTSNLNLAIIPSSERVAIDTALAKLKQEARASGDTLGYLRASAGGKDVSEAFLTSFEKGANVIAQISDIQNTISGEATGPIMGVLRSKNPYDAKAQQLKAKLTALVPNLARGVYGEVGVLTDQDVALYSKTLPNLTSTEAVNKAILSSTIRSVARSLERKLRVSADGGRDVSGYVPQYLELMGQANDLLVQSDPSRFRVADGALYEKNGSQWVLTK